MASERPLTSAPTLALIDTIARAVARAKKLPPDDVEHFARRVRASMTEGDITLPWTFDGQASVRTYLTIVVARQLRASVAELPRGDVSPH